MIRAIAGCASALMATACAAVPAPNEANQAQVAMASFAKLTEVDPRFQSYNIEMVELTGGRFWAPYGGPDGETYRQRGPVDLTNQRLRSLAWQLAPAFVRVSGSWANSTYVPAIGETIAEPPEGFSQVLQFDQWRGLVAFSKAVDAPIVTSFAASSGTRDEAGQWTATQAQRLFELTKDAGGAIHGAEFINEPSLLGPGSLPADYTAPDFISDFDIFADWIASVSPQTLLLGPGNMGEATVSPETRKNLMAPDGAMGADALLAGTAERLDGVSWHFYGGVSPRCGGQNGPASQEAALRDSWLDRTLIEYDEVAQMRDRHAPGKPLWLTETAQAACGGSPWAASFRDSFRYLNQLGALARHGVRVVMHNTLAASEYGLIDQDTFEPRPNYWAAVLWQRNMGTVVLDAGEPSPGALRLFAHCLPSGDGGVGLLAINPSPAPVALQIDGAAKLWLMQADDLSSRTVLVNGKAPRLQSDDSLAGLEAVSVSGAVQVPAQAIVFVARPDAGNAACY